VALAQFLVGDEEGGLHGFRQGYVSGVVGGRRSGTASPRSRPAQFISLTR
jgi:hypothetical protein